MYSYQPLWDTMRMKDISTYKLMQLGISSKMLYNLQHNKNVTVLTLEKLCTILSCRVEDVVEIIPDK